MTPAPDLNTDKFVALLNEDLGTEYQSIVQYTNHIATITGPEFLSIIDELKIHLGQELSHAQILAEQVSFLGGEPSTTVPAVASSAVRAVACRASTTPRNPQGPIRSGTRSRTARR